MTKSHPLPARLQDRWRRASRTVRRIILGTVLVLLALRLALPFVLKDYVDKQLNKSADYAGQIGGLRVHLWRGAYEIRDVKILRRGGGVPVPLFSAPVIDLSLQWGELFHGAVVGEVHLREPNLNFVAGPTPDQSQAGLDERWVKTMASLFPFRLNQFEIRDGQIRFQDFHAARPVDIYLTNLFAMATNLTNTRTGTDKLSSGLRATGQALGGGQFALDLKMDLLAAAPTFELNAVLTNVDMVALNDFLRSYGKLDVARGNFSLFTSVASDQGNYAGQIKVLFRNLDVFAWEKERKKNVLEIFWEAVAGALSAGFKNHPHDQLAANIPISGSFTNANVHILSAVGSLLHNAFIRALVPKIDQPVKLQDVEKTER